MLKALITSLLDAFRISAERAPMPTGLGTAELRELGAGVLARSVFSARATNAIFASKLKEVVDQLAAGDIGEGQARTAMYEVLDILNYDVEKGGFPGEELEPGLRGTLQDLRSFRRMDLIIRTQLALMEGAGVQYRAMLPENLLEFPAQELVRGLPVEVARDWPSRWAIAGGKPIREGHPVESYKEVGAKSGMIALVGDPVWGELGSFENFKDALGVDHAPFYFNSEMTLEPVSRARCMELKITGPNGESIEEFHAGAKRPRVMAGELPLPMPQVSMAGVDPELVERFKKSTYGTSRPGKPMVVDFSENLARSLKAADEAYRKEAP